MAELGMVSSSQEMIDYTEKLAKALGIDIYTVKASVEDAEKIATVFKKKDVKCIMARGRMADILHELQMFSVVSCNPMAFDITKALTLVPVDVKEVVVAVYEPVISYNTMFSKDVISAMEEVSGRKLVFLTYQSNADLKNRLHEQLKKGKLWYVGTKSIVNIAGEHGQKGIELLSGEETMLNAFSEAFNVLGNQKRIFRESAILSDIIDITKQGVITTDAGGKITAINSHALRLIPEEDLQVGKSIVPFLPASAKAIKSGEELQDEVCFLKNKKIIINQRPFFLEEEVIGALINIQDAEVIEQLEGKIRNQLKQRGLVARWRFKDILGNSPEINQAKKKAAAFARTEYNILISGETGTGKEMFAHSIHLASKKHKGPFIVVNCSALPESLLESELFGYAPGAFTGARKEGKTGLFELANDGTIFLDEINSVNYHTQSRLLRVIEEKRVMRLGSDRYTNIDVRVISAANKNLWDAVMEGKFRRDLYFRLNELALVIPPLRQRTEDIPLFINSFLKKFGYRGQKKEEIMSLIQNLVPHHAWPGNVRELENLLKRIITLLNQTSLAELTNELYDDFSAKKYMTEGKHIMVSLGTLEEMENEIVSQVAALYNNDIGRIAATLGVSKTTGWRRLKRAMDGIRK